MNSTFINADYVWDIPAINITISYSLGTHILKNSESNPGVVAQKFQQVIESERPELKGGFICAFKYDILSRMFIVTYAHHKLKATEWTKQLPLLRLEKPKEGETFYSFNYELTDIPWNPEYMEALNFENAEEQPSVVITIVPNELNSE